MMDSIRVAVLSGSRSDAAFVEVCTAQLEAFAIVHEARVLSAHRQAEKVVNFVREAEASGCEVFIGMAGMAAHLPGVIASLTAKPVLGVPLPGGMLDGLDAALSISQMPGGVPVGCLAVGKAGARNAAVLAAQILSLADPELAARVDRFRSEMAEGGR